ncbi:uncharacterized protein LOC117175188 [Belonocnema kinseyi]|uniref:uncharacterized protein LOC117175188 n=1 Tax=Belonocnema kinseyi TaxID=2817044 RepID=UPI00143DCAD7|nr:uncharacterized protein LOC117175188 [Belonocnema kinseyi]
MVPITKPYLKITPDKLYVSRRPQIISCILFVFTVIICTTFFYYFLNGAFVLTIIILGEIIFGLDAFGEREEFMLEKSKNLATFTKYSWCDKLFSKSAESYTLKMKLSDIRHVGVSQNIGLFMLPRNGKAVTLSTRGLKRDEVQNIKRDINFFLNTTRLEYTDHKSADLGYNFLSTSDSDEYLQSLLRKCSRRSSLKKLPFSSVQQHQSTPSFGSQRAQGIPEFPQRIIKRRPYGSNLFFQNIHSSQTRRRS